MIASAPGKVVICGEYAVRRGAPALVGAVNARVFAQWRLARAGESPSLVDGSSSPGPRSPDGAALGPELVVAQELATMFYGADAGQLVVDRSAMYLHDTKLGLGSSAAGTVATVTAIAASAGVEWASPQGRQDLFDLSMKAHRAVAPTGSGIDVAAAVWGGLLRFQAGVAPQPMSWPRSVCARVVWTGQAARTSSFVEAVDRFAVRDPRAHDACLDAIDAAREALVDAIAQEAPNPAIGAVADHHAAMAKLGQGAGVPIVNPPLQRVAALAAARGGAAKPSGAGGGDVALAIFANDSDADAFARDCAAEAMPTLPLRLGEPGVRAEASGCMPSRQAAPALGNCK